MVRQSELLLLLGQTLKLLALCGFQYFHSAQSILTVDFFSGLRKFCHVVKLLAQPWIGEWALGVFTDLSRTCVCTSLPWCLAADSSCLLSFLHPSGLACCDCVCLSVREPWVSVDRDCADWWHPLVLSPLGSLLGHCCLTPQTVLTLSTL